MQPRDRQDKGAACLWPLTAGCAACLLPVPALAAGVSAGPKLIAALPFAGLLLSVALLPALAPRLWHRRAGTVFLLWALGLVLPQAAAEGAGPALAEAWRALLEEYLPFISLLLALYVASGGILVKGGVAGGPAGNTGLLALGTLLAGVMGTTGAAMVLIRPLLRANAHRRRKLHLVVFFIVLVANAGGITTPLGDPPLYLGYLHGVPFLWPVRNLWPALALVAGPLLLLFYLWDRHAAAADPPARKRSRLRLRGWPNVALLAAVVATVLVQGAWHPGELVLAGAPIATERLFASLVFLGVAALSVLITPRAVRQGNMFTWEPIVEVAKLFAAVFVTIAPVVAMLRAGQAGPMAPLLHLTDDPSGAPRPAVYFWLTGALSAFLDNAPTYLVFFNQAGGDAATLTGPLSDTLRAISAGAVFFGALTYIGNAPNMMVRSIAAHRGVHMPGFFGYAGLACALLLPLFALITFVVL